MESIGAQLKKRREALQMSVKDVAEQINAKLEIITDIEADDFRRMPADIYARGFVRLYAQCVGLDPAPLMAQYAQMQARPAAAEEPHVPSAAVLKKAAAPDEAHPGAKGGFPSALANRLRKITAPLLSSAAGRRLAPPPALRRTLVFCAAAAVLIFAGFSAWQAYSRLRVERIAGNLRVIEPAPEWHINFEPPGPG